MNWRDRRRIVAALRLELELGPRLSCGLTLGVDSDRAVAAATGLTVRTICNLRREAGLCSCVGPQPTKRSVSDERIARRTAEIVAAAPVGWRGDC